MAMMRTVFALGSGSVCIANVARTLVPAAPAILPAPVREPATAPPTSAETRLSLGAADTSGKRFLTETSLAQLTTAQQLVSWLVESVRATPAQKWAFKLTHFLALLSLACASHAAEWKQLFNHKDL